MEWGATAMSGAPARVSCASCSGWTSTCMDSSQCQTHCEPTVHSLITHDLVGVCDLLTTRSDQGMMAKTSGSTKCSIKCREGSVRVYGANQTQCKLCDAGTVSPAPGGHQCSVCGAGKYSPVKGQRVCGPRMS